MFPLCMVIIEHVKVTAQTETTPMGVSFGVLAFDLDRETFRGQIEANDCINSQFHLVLKTYLPDPIQTWLGCTLDTTKVYVIGS